MTTVFDLANILPQRTFRSHKNVNSVNPLQRFKTHESCFVGPASIDNRFSASYLEAEHKLRSVKGGLGYGTDNSIWGYGLRRR